MLSETSTFIRLKKIDHYTSLLFALIKNSRFFALLLTMLFLRLATNAQAPQLKFIHLTTDQGLPDGTVRSITQDKYGYIWLATQYGVCRYNSSALTSYSHTNADTTSLPGNFVWSVFTDRDGDVWIGTDQFISKYNYHTNDFTSYKCGYNVTITRMVEDEKGMIWLGTSGGLMQFNKHSGLFAHYRNHADTLVRKLGTIRINDIYADLEEHLLYLATHEGLRIFDYRKEKLLPPIIDAGKDPYEINTGVTSAVTKDKTGAIWFGCGFTNSVLVRWQPGSRNLTYYNDLTEKSRGWSENRVLSLMTDREGNVWAGGFTSSLSLFLPSKNIFYHYQNDALLKSSVAGTSVIALYQDRAGMIWAGMEGYGVDRFNTTNTLFTSFQRQAATQPSLLHDWGRAAIEDDNGKIWFGTAKGISVFDPRLGSYKNYFNDEHNSNLLSFNTIRSFTKDRNGRIWVGTGNGLNRFDPATGRFKIYRNEGSLKSYFIWGLLERRNGDIYVGGTGGLQRYDKEHDKFVDITDDSLFNRQLKHNVRNIFEDSKQGLWIGFYDNGLAYCLPDQKKIVRYHHEESKTNSLCSDFVTSVTEDKNGIIWIATRDGLSSLDTRTQTFTNYTTAQGLPANKTAALRIDRSNRLWIATGKGLSMLDPDRKNFHLFDMSDGLPTNEFNDQEAAATRDGKFIYPTFRGFILFDPEIVQKRKPGLPPVYAAAFYVFNKPFSSPVNAEEIKELHLTPDQNFFSIELIALNYESPDKLLYAYKLEPFDKDWIYTKDRMVTYTNVTGGDYKFLYKTTTDANNWNTPEKEIQIHVGTVFYKKTWFIVLLVTVLLSLLYGIYSFRLRQAAKFHRLQLQAARLEKDKTEIQYQNLINQFNPHFLFNSLTSLNSLIYENKELASEFLEQLSAVYRYLLTHKETQLVRLQDEAEFIKHYVSLLRTRFGNGLTIKIEIPERVQQKKLVPVTFQLLIENAIKHNTLDEESPLVISFKADEHYLYVTNNIQKRSFVETSNRKGLDSLQTLYKYLSSLPFVVEETDSNFTIGVPLL